MDDSEWLVDWEDGDSSNKLEEVQEDRERERQKIIKNPNLDEEHQIYKPLAIQYNWYYEYKPENDVFEYSHEERVEDGEPEEVYRCTCCVYEMSKPEAKEHLKKAKSISE